MQRLLFKLISEANAILTDAAKKSLYDSKIRASAAIKAPPHYMNRSSNINRRYGAQSSVNVHNAFRNLNQQYAATSSSVRQDVFWTACAFCHTRYQYQRVHINKSLKCQACSKNFMACESSGQAKWGQPAAQVPLKPGFSQPAAFQQKVELNQSYCKVGGQFQKGSSSSDAGLHGFASRKSVHPDPGVKAGSCGGINAGSAFNGNGYLKANGTSYKHCGKSNGIPTKDTTDVKNSRKRSRKVVLESSESSDSSDDTDTDEEKLEAVSGGFATDNNPGTVHIRRKSSRLKQNVTYKFNESDDDDDVASPIKRRKVSKNSVDKNSDAGESLPDKDAECDTGGKVDEGGAAETVEVEFDSGIESESGEDPGVVMSECPDPEFYEFDRDREANLFNINQTWACYDEKDQMPRFYAKITKVNTSPFELCFKLEVFPISEADDNWVAAGLPVGCGTYKLGKKTEKTSELNTFSHQMICVSGKKRGTWDIYPRDKEVWALFKDWDIGWSLNPEKHVELQYEVVEVLSNCVDDAAGIRVCYLEKVPGCQSVFKRSSRSEFDPFWIRPDELYRFSHRVSNSGPLKGTERDGVPVGSFELDPASLPLNPDHLHYSSKEEEESGASDPIVRKSPKCAEEKHTSVKSAAAVNETSFIDLDDSA